VVSPERPPVKKADQREWKPWSVSCINRSKTIHGIVVTNFFMDREFIGEALHEPSTENDLPGAAESCHPAFSARGRSPNCTPFCVIVCKLERRRDPQTAQFDRPGSIPPNGRYPFLCRPRPRNLMRLSQRARWREVPFRQSTDSRPVSIARIVQRRAAIQKAWRCPGEQKRCADPPVRRGVNGRPHQTHLAAAAQGGVASDPAVRPTTGSSDGSFKSGGASSMSEHHALGQCGFTNSETALKISTE
jgi:hypothetical protein